MKSFEARKPFRILSGIMALFFWPITFGIAKMESESIIEMLGIAAGGSIFALALTLVAITGKIPARLRNIFHPSAWRETKEKKKML